MSGVIKILIVLLSIFVIGYFINVFIYGFFYAQGVNQNIEEYETKCNNYQFKQETPPQELYINPSIKQFEFKFYPKLGQRESKRIGDAGGDNRYDCLITQDLDIDIMLNGNLLSTHKYKIKIQDSQITDETIDFNQLFKVLFEKYYYLYESNGIFLLNSPINYGNFDIGFFEETKEVSPLISLDGGKNWNKVIRPTFLEKIWVFPSPDTKISIEQIESTDNLKIKVSSKRPDNNRLVEESYELIKNGDDFILHIAK